MKRRYKVLVGISLVFCIGFLLPENKVVPVLGATANDWNKDSFWYEPWGTSGVHKGVDIFARSGTRIVATTSMLLLYKGSAGKGSISKGGNIVIGLGPKWRLHYFAHMESINPQSGYFASVGSDIGSVGDTGNAKGKQPHLHYSIIRLLPLPWKIDSSTQGYKKAVYLNPVKYLSSNSR